MTENETNDMGGGHSPMCDADMVKYDQEWVGPSQWRHKFVCPRCDEEREMMVQGAIVGDMVFDPSGKRWRQRQTKQITDRYLRAPMSEESLERSLDRVYGLDETA